MRGPPRVPALHPFQVGKGLELIGGHSQAEWWCAPATPGDAAGSPAVIGGEKEMLRLRRGGLKGRLLCAGEGSRWRMVSMVWASLKKRLQAVEKGPVVRPAPCAYL